MLLKQAHGVLRKVNHDGEEASDVNKSGVYIEVHLSETGSEDNYKSNQLSTP